VKAIDVTRLRERRVFQGRKFEARPALFPGYCFVLIELQWHAARWAPGTLGLVMDGITPARMPERVIAESHRREGQWLDRGLQTIVST
jgi:transcription antitermination factor NusG